MANPIDTPQIILGLDSEGVFQDFENKRRRGGSSLSDWYADATSKGNIWLSTIENNDIISFSHKFNSDSPGDQALFVFEVLDPTNTFESRFFDTFYRGAESFSEIMEEYGSDIVTIEDLTDGKAMATSARKKLGRLPFSTPMYVTFGMGNDLAGWSPAIKATLATMEYGLTHEGLKKLILRFIPNPGALRLSNPTSVERYLKATSNTKIHYSELVMKAEPPAKPPEPPTKEPLNFVDPSLKFDPKPEEPKPDEETGGSVSIRNPVNIVFDIFKNVIKSTTKSSVIFLLDELKKPLKTRWNSLVTAAAKQTIGALKDIKIVGAYDPGLASELEQTALDELLIPAMADSEITEEELEKGVKVNGGIDVKKELDKLNFEERFPRALASRQAGIFGAGYVARFAKFDDYLGTVDRLSRKGLTSDSLFADWFLADHTVEDIKKVENLVKYTEWHPNWQLNRINDSDETRAEFKYFYKTLLKVELTDEEMEIYETRRTPGGGRGLLATGIELDQTTVEAAALHTLYDIDRVWAQFEKARNSPEWNDPNNIFRYRKGADAPETRQEAKSRIEKDKEAWPEFIKINTIDVFTIFQTAFKNFFDTLGLTCGQVRPPVPVTHGSGVPLVDPPGSDKSKQERIEEEMKIPIYVSITTKTAEELKQKLVGIIDGLGAGPSTNLTMHSFSELSLVKSLSRSVGDDSIIPTGRAPNGSLKTKEVLFITSLKVLGSLINGTELDTETLKLMGPLYHSVKNGWNRFNEGEPSIHSSEDVPFSQLFKHPKLEELQLSTDNVLTLFSDDKELKFDDSGKLNKYLLKNNIPVFNYGFKNSNILNFNFDLKLWYAHLLNILPQIAINGAKLPSVAQGDVNHSVLKFWKGSNAAEDFVNSVGAYYDKHISGENAKNSAGHPDLPKGSLAWADHEKSRLEIYGMVSDEFKKSGGGGDDDEILSNRQYYINSMVRRIKDILNNSNNSDYLLINSENQDTAMENLLAIRRQMESRLFTAKITTLPFFSFISLGKVLGKTALLYFMEPEVVASVGSRDKRLRSTWLSGSYLIVGYDVTMSNSRLTTSFNLIKQ